MEYGGMFDELKGLESYQQRAQLLTAFLKAISRKKLSKNDLKAIETFVFGETEALPPMIRDTKDFRMRDELLDYEDKIMGLLTVLSAYNYPLDPTRLDSVQNLLQVSGSARAFENAFDETMERDAVHKEVMEKLIAMASAESDEYQKGKFYSGLNYHANALDKLDASAKEAVRAYIRAEIDRYLLEKDSLTEDALYNLEMIADVCVYFIDDTIIALLKELLNLDFNNVRFYAMVSYLKAGQRPDAEWVCALANDLVYAELTYGILEEHALTDMFPRELADPDYLAKSDMVHWLTYPTELGTVPDEIELLGRVNVKDVTYHVFKFRANGDAMSDELKNKWLVGWSSRNGGGTFSHFDELSMYERKDMQKTLKVIKKKVLG